MKFSAREDMEIPIDDAFALISDIENYERIAVRHGIDVERLVESAPPEIGIKWQARFKFRGKAREVKMEITECEAPNILGVTTYSQDIQGLGVLELVSLSRSITRMAVELDLKPTTLKSRLLMQSMKLAKSTLSKKYKKRISDFAKTIEMRYQAKS